LTFQIFAKENCILCRKAQEVLSRVGVEMRVRYVEGPNATADNVADFAWHDWVDKMPLVVAMDGTEVVERWDGEGIEKGFTPAVRRLLDADTTTATATSA
jgi:hypothetical protein